ncbi:hypothetical protein D9M71_637000 [compost metagenome]
MAGPFQHGQRARAAGGDLYQWPCRQRVLCAAGPHPVPAGGLRHGHATIAPGGAGYRQSGPCHPHAVSRRPVSLDRRWSQPADHRDHSRLGPCPACGHLLRLLPALPAAHLSTASGQLHRAGVVLDRHDGQFVLPLRSGLSEVVPGGGRGAGADEFRLLGQCHGPDDGRQPGSGARQ